MNKNKTVTKKRRFSFKKSEVDANWEKTEAIIGDFWSDILFLINNKHGEYLEYAYTIGVHDDKLKILTDSINDNKLLYGYELIEYTDHDLSKADIKLIKKWRDDYSVT